MEMLIVVAIIAILIAVAIPVFSAQLHKAKGRNGLGEPAVVLRRHTNGLYDNREAKPESPRRLAHKPSLRLAFGDVFERTESQNESRLLRGEF